MIVKKFGKAVPDPELGLWVVENKPDRFTMNKRLIDGRRDVKIVRTAYSRHASRYIPSSRRRAERAEYVDQRTTLKKELDLLIAQVYKEVLEDSFFGPIPLRKDKDAEHRGDWRYCLYKGDIYQFDRPDYLPDEMVEQITASESHPS